MITFIKTCIQPTTTFKRADLSELNNKIRATDWSFLQINNINNATCEFTNNFLELAASCIPTSLATIRPSDRPWYNSEITSQQRDRQKQKAGNSGRLSDWNTCKRIRNEINNMKKHSKNLFLTI